MAENPTAARLALLSGGYLPIPCEGKRPVLMGWQKRGETNEIEIKFWAQVYGLAENTGILTGRTPTLDIDVTDAAAAEAVEMLVRERFEDRGTIMVRIGLPPKRAILFQLEGEPFPKDAVSLIAPNGTEQR